MSPSHPSSVDLRSTCPHSLMRAVLYFTTTRAGGGLPPYSTYMGKGVLVFCSSAGVCVKSPVGCSGGGGAFPAGAAAAAAAFALSHTARTSGAAYLAGNSRSGAIFSAAANEFAAASLSPERNCIVPRSRRTSALVVGVQRFTPQWVAAESRRASAV